jgi:hypothetical protein
MQLGGHVAPMWDAVALVGQLLDDGPPASLAQLNGTFALAEGPVTVAHGRVSAGGVPLLPVCVPHLDLGDRRTQTCSDERLFPVHRRE